MKAMVLQRKNEPFVLEERPDPKAGPGEAVARVIACGSGLTIHHTRAGRTAANYPIVIGHEVLGEIVEVGHGVHGFKVGRHRHPALLPELRALSLVPGRPGAPVR